MYEYGQGTRKRDETNDYSDTSKEEIDDSKTKEIGVELNKNKKKIDIVLNTAEGHEYTREFIKEEYLSEIKQKNVLYITFSSTLDSKKRVIGTRVKANNIISTFRVTATNE